MPIAGSPNRSLAWKRPDEFNPPKLINLAIARLREADRQMALFEQTKVYSRKDRSDTERRRKPRSDGMRNWATLATAVIASSDLERGYVGAPIGAGQWRRHSIESLARRAYGELIHDDVSLRRAVRHLRHLVDGGLLTICQITVETPDGPRAEIAIKHVTDAFYDALEMKATISAWRIAKRREKAKERLQSEAGKGLGAKRRRGSGGAAEKRAQATRDAAQPVASPPDAVDDEQRQRNLAQVHELMRGLTRSGRDPPS